MKDNYKIPPEEYEKIKEWCSGHTEAIAFVVAITEAFRIADNFVDKDVEMDDSKDMTRLLHLLVVDIPSNNFFIQCRGWIVPFISTTIQLWNASNIWRGSDCNKTKTFAVICKELYHFIIPHIALLTGGYEHMQKVILEGQEYCVKYCKIRELGDN